MKKIILLALLMPIAASAGHHRGHAAGFLDGMVNGFHFEIAIWQMGQVDQLCELDATQQRNLDVVIGYSQKMIDWLPGFRDNILTGDLDIARRQWSQPDSSGGQSVQHLLASTMHHLRQLTYQCEGTADIHVSGAIARITWAWSLAEYVNWHIIDAIREEVYEDPDFICSGEGNHCE